MVSKLLYFSATGLKYSANHNTLGGWPIIAHITFQSDKLCKESVRFNQDVEAEGQDHSQEHFEV